MAMIFEPSLQPEHCATLLLLPLCAPVVDGFLWFPAKGALGLGAVRCLLCWPSASRLSMRLAPFSCFPPRCWLLPGDCCPPPPLLSRGFRRCRSVCCSACAGSWAPWLLFPGVPARCVVLGVRCPGPPGSCSPVCPLGVLFRVCGVLGPLAPVHRCARSVCCVACAVSWASWLLFTGVPARCVVLRVRCPGPPASCSPVCAPCVLFCVCGVVGRLAPVHRCARSVCCVACAVSWASWLLFTPAPARCVVLLCGASLQGAHSSIRTAAIVAGRGWVPSGRTHVHLDGGCSQPAGAGYLLGAHSSIRTAHA